VFILVGEVTEASLKSNAIELKKDKQNVLAGFYPLGTAFVVKSSAKNTLLTADHIITESYAIANWFIIEEVGRDVHGNWIFDNTNKMIAVAVIDRDPDNDLAILEAQYKFDENDMISLCPGTEIPNVLDEYLFKTYYCPLGDCVFDYKRPMLNIRVSEKKKMICLRRSSDGRIWFDGGLCYGSSGGAVVDMKGRVIAMHTESRSDIKTAADIQKDQLQSSKKRVLSKIDDVSEAHDSSAHSYSSSQYCILLSLNSLVLSHVV